MLNGNENGERWYLRNLLDVGDEMYKSQEGRFIAELLIYRSDATDIYSEKKNVQKFFSM